MAVSVASLRATIARLATRAPFEVYQPNLWVAVRDVVAAISDLRDDVDAGSAVADESVTMAKIADGTAGELITWDATGEAVTVAVGTATHVLTSNGAGLPPTFQAVSGGSGLTQPQVMARQAFGGF